MSDNEVCKRSIFCLQIDPEIKCIPLAAALRVLSCHFGYNTLHFSQV